MAVPPLSEPAGIRMRWTDYWRLFAIALVAVVLVDQASGLVLSRLWRGIRAGEGVGRINVGSDRACQVLILGSSKARHGYDDALLSEALGIPVYNAGLNGQGILAARAMLEIRRDAGRPMPRWVIVDAAWMGDEPQKLPALAAWSSKCRWLDDELVKAVGWPWRFERHSALWRHGGKLFPALSNLGRREDAHGFTALKGDLDPTPEPAQAPFATQPAPAWYADELAALVSSIKAAGSQPVLVISPTWIPDSESYRQLIGSVAASNGVPLLDYVSRPAPGLSDRSRFRDIRHLNDRGAALFAGVLEQDLIRLGVAPRKDKTR